MHNYAALRVNNNWAVSLSQLCATHLNTGSPMLSNVSTWGCTQYFFKSCQTIRPPVCVQSASGGCIDPFPPKTEQMQCYSITTMHWRTSLTDRHFFPKKDFCQLFDDGSFCYPQMKYIHNQCQWSIFALRTGFFASLIIKTLKVWQWSTELLCPCKSL